MSEVEKMYENAGVKKQYDYTVIKKNYNGKIGYTKRAVLEKVEQFKNKTLRIIEVCFFYPEFTAEKQIELIKWCLDNYRGYIFDSIETDWFEEQLCAFINNIWQDLTEEERKQIKNILE